MTDTSLPEAVQFFAEHAPWAYYPETQTPEEGKLESAESLAVAEATGRVLGLSFTWAVDDGGDSGEFSDEQPAWSVWICTVSGASGVLGALGAIDFGRDGSPDTDPEHRRVVEAQLADEVIQ